jgi:hypothetical protein
MAKVYDNIPDLVGWVDQNEWGSDAKKKLARAIAKDTNLTKENITEYLKIIYKGLSDDKKATVTANALTLAISVDKIKSKSNSAPQKSSTGSTTKTTAGQSAADSKAISGAKDFSAKMLTDFAEVVNDNKLTVEKLVALLTKYTQRSETGTIATTARTEARLLTYYDDDDSGASSD